MWVHPRVSVGFVLVGLKYLCSALSTIVFRFVIFHLAMFVLGMTASDYLSISSHFSHLIFQKVLWKTSCWKVFFQLGTNEEMWNWQLDFDSKRTIFSLFCLSVVLSVIYYLICVSHHQLSCMEIVLYIYDNFSGTKNKYIMF